MYNQGLRKYPKNFDLAYNKARLELEFATHPVLVKALDVPVVVVLQESLKSHQYASGLEPDNSDTLFNIAQVLTALAEILAKDGSARDDISIQYLEQALQYQQKCLQLQMIKYSESRQLQDQAVSSVNDSEDDDVGGAQLDTRVTSAYEDREAEQWLITEPITAITLIDTVLAQLATLTTLCTVLSSSLMQGGLSQPQVLPAWIENYATKLIDDELGNILSSTSEDLSSRTNEIALSKSILGSNMLELAFKVGSLTNTDYLLGLEQVFNSSTLDLKSSVESLLAFSKA